MANPRVTRIAELKAQIESAKAEIAQIQADEQAEVAEDSQLDGTLMNRNTDDAIAAYEADKKNNELLVDTKSSGLELEGNRNDQGDFIEAQTYREMTADEQKLNDAIMADDWDGTLTDELQLIANGMSDQDFIDTGIPVVDKKVFTIDDTEDDKIQGELPPEEIITEKQISSPEDDLDKDERTDAESEKQKFMGIDREQGRTMAMEDDLPERSMGFKADDGGNMSVDEKDDFWKTQEGYDKAVEMYGSKPAWVKEPTMQWNPSEQEYEEVEPEEFEDLSRPSISADIKKLFG